MATQEIIEQVKETDLSFRAIRQTVKRILREIFKSNVYANPLYLTTGGDTFDLLIAVWTNDEKLHLLCSKETSVQDIRDRTCIGAGLYLANYLLSLVPDQQMSRSDVEFWAVHILHQVKKYVPGCGGDSEFLFLGRDGKILNIKGSQLSLKEDDLENLTVMLPGLLSLAADLELSDQMIAGSADLFKESLLVAREERRKRIESIRRIEEYIARRKKEEEQR